MTRTCIVQNGIVTSTIVATVEEAQRVFPELICIESTSGEGPGWLWDGSKLIPPEVQAIVPTSITRWQALTILNQSGLLDEVEAYVGTLTDRQAQIDFSAASIWRRDWSWLGDAATALGWTSEQVDQMFIAAAAL